MKIDYSDPISSHFENGACCCLRVLSRRLSVASFVLTFSPVPLRLERKSSGSSVGFFMYFRLVYSPEFFVVASRRKSTRKLFRQKIKLMVLIDQELVGNSTSPLCILLSPIHMGISLSLGKRLTEVFWDTHGCQKPKSQFVRKC